MVDPAYERLPRTGPHEPRLGGALISWVEPTPEHVVAYNRWYEDDHMITGAMVIPWVFACRRFVAPRSIQDLRAPATSHVAVPLSAGKYISLYWINEGRRADSERWAIAANHRLIEEGRSSCRGAGHDPAEERRQIFTAFCDYLGACYRDEAVPRDVHTLSKDHLGLVIELIETSGDDREALADWVVNDYLPGARVDGVAISLCFAPARLPADRLQHVQQVDGVDRLLAVVHFLDAEPRETWGGRFANSAERIGAAGFGSLAVQAAFIPTVQGTNVYTDELF